MSKGLTVAAGFAIWLASSPVRPPLTPIHGALTTELQGALTVGSSPSSNVADDQWSGRFLRAKPILHRT